MTEILHARALAQFSCLGDKCEDTCCKGWSMQLDAPTFEHYRKDAPELMEAVDEDESGRIMRKDPATSFCVKLEGGLCGIHKKYGDTFLGDACYFYPRVTRRLGDKVLMTATLSCPEIARLALADDQPAALEMSATERLPHSLKNYLPEGMTAEEAIGIHQTFLAAAGEATEPERIVMRLSSASRSLERIEKKDWPAMAGFYLKNADQRLPPPVVNPADPFNLLHALCGLMVASKKTPSPRLMQTVADMEKVLAVKLDWETVHISTTEASLPAYQQLQKLWREKSAAYFAPVLRRWLMMQLSLALYPFAGLGGTLSERVTIIGVRFATLKLALAASYAIYKESPEETVRVLQSLSRLLDHLGDPAFSLQIYAETGWNQENRLRGLLEI